MLKGISSQGYIGRHAVHSEENMVIPESTSKIPGLRDLLPTPKRENTIMSAFVEAGLTSVLPLLSFKSEEQVEKTDSEEEKSYLRSRAQDMKRRMNRKMRVVQNLCEIQETT